MWLDATLDQRKLVSIAEGHIRELLQGRDTGRDTERMRQMPLWGG